MNARFQCQGMLKVQESINNFCWLALLHHSFHHLTSPKHAVERKNEFLAAALSKKDKDFITKMYTVLGQTRDL